MDFGGWGNGRASKGAWGLVKALRSAFGASGPLGGGSRRLELRLGGRIGGKDITFPEVPFGL